MGGRRIMALPTSTDIRSFLEGYGIDSSVLSNDWINTRISNFIVPFVERVIKRKVEGTEQVTEYLSGTGKNILILSRKNVTSLVSINYVTGGDYETSLNINNIELISSEGVLKSLSNISEGDYSRTFFKGIKNIKVVYNIGSSTIENDIKEAVIMLTAEKCLELIADRTGGGNLNVQGYGRNFGERGKYTNIRNNLKRSSLDLLKKYTTGVIST
jgi:hypothetical protein